MNTFTTQTVMKQEG